MKKEIALFGGTGLIGSNILHILEDDNDYSLIRVITRRPVEFTNQKFSNIVINFNNYKAIKDSIKGCRAVFVSIGTTQSKVKWDLKEYKKIDYKIPIDIAKACIENNINKYLIYPTTMFFMLTTEISDGNNLTELVYLLTNTNVYYTHLCISRENST